MDSPSHQFRKTKTVADILDCSRKTVVQLIQRGELDAIKIGRREFRVADDAIKAFINSKRYTNGRQAKKKSMRGG